MKIVVISDTHGRWNKLTIPECDLLISAGDYSFRGEEHMVRDFHKWLNKQPAKHVISVQGNHEKWVEKNFPLAKEIAKEACPRVHFIDEGLIEIEGIKIWCSAWTPFFHNWAWNSNRGKDIKRHWDLIPEDVDILVTHGPPYGILDLVRFGDGSPKELVGCKDLLAKIQTLSKLKCHFFGHIHETYGHEYINGVHFYNASICDEHYAASNRPVVVEI